MARYKSEKPFYNASAGNFISRQAAKQKRRDNLLQRVREALTILEENNQPVTQRAVAEIVGTSPGTLRNHPRVYSLLKQVEQNQSQRAEDAVAASLIRILQEMKLNGRPISQNTVAAALGIDRSVIRCSTRLYGILKKFKLNPGS